MRLLSCCGVVVVVRLTDMRPCCSGIWACCAGVAERLWHAPFRHHCAAWAHGYHRCAAVSRYWTVGTPPGLILFLCRSIPLFGCWRRAVSVFDVDQGLKQGGGNTYRRRHWVARRVLAVEVHSTRLSLVVLPSAVQWYVCVIQNTNSTSRI